MTGTMNKIVEKDLMVMVNTTKIEEVDLVVKEGSLNVSYGLTRNI
jgi:hypothetical protein